VADEDDNVVLRLLREIRSEQGAQRATMETIDGRITTIERHMEDVKESVAYALGLSAHANVAYETTGQRPDRLRDTVARLEARIETLERSR
jgi:ubiquinone biosynthesis protein UbiJ